MTNVTYDLLVDLTPEELEPRLELQVITDPLSVLSASSNTCCRDGGNCSTVVAECNNNCRDGGNCNVGDIATVGTRRIFR